LFQPSLRMVICIPSGIKTVRNMQEPKKFIWSMSPWLRPLVSASM
jgi:hypothetical protein